MTAIQPVIEGTFTLNGPNTRIVHITNTNPQGYASTDYENDAGDTLGIGVGGSDSGAWTGEAYVNAGTSALEITTGKLRLDVSTATSATTGTNGATPSQVVGYLEITINGTAAKVPYYTT